MTKKTRILSFVLCFALLLGMVPGSVFAVGAEDGFANFTKRNAFSSDMFEDVAAGDWCYDNVKAVYQLGLMLGNSQSTFDPNGDITVAQTVTIAARLHAIYTTGSDAFEASTPWYQSYVDYALENGIITSAYSHYDAVATRGDFAQILASALPAEALAAVNAVAAGRIPDVDLSAPYAAAVYTLYRAGITVGKDDAGSYAPNDTITRGEVAAIVSRMAVKALRQSIKLGEDYTVTFNTNGASMTIAPQTVFEGELATKPQDPTVGSYSLFTGWFTAPVGGDEFDFNTPIRSNITLYAQWTANTALNDWLALQWGAETYTVTFDLNYDGATDAPVAQIVRAGDCVREPAAPEREGYVFEGWYLDDAGNDAFDFTLPVVSDTTLFAKWTLIGFGGDGEHRVTFIADADSAEVYGVKTVDNGAKVTAPADPQRDLYRFTGWYEDAAGTMAYDFTDPVIGDLTLYAGWGNPDPTVPGLYAATDTEETIYSVSGIVIENGVADVTVNVNSLSVLFLEVYEDTLGENWSKEAMDQLLSGTPVNCFAAYTPSYGEMISVSVPMDVQLPTHYFIRARLLSGNGIDLCEPYLYIGGSAQYKVFDSKTIYDYDPELAINFDDNTDTNFGVLVEGTKKITVSDTVNRLIVTDIDIPDELVPEHTYTIFDPDASVTSLAAGDVVFILDTQYLFMVASVTTNPDGSITLTPNNDTELTDFYSMLKVDMGPSSDESLEPASFIIDNQPRSDAYVVYDSMEAKNIDFIDEDKTLTKAFTFPSVEFNPKPWLTLKWDLTITETVDIKLVYDVHLFGEDYIEISFISKTETAGTASVSVSPADAEGDNPLEYDLLRDHAKISIPTGIPGLDFYVQLKLPVELKLEAGIYLVHSSTTTNGVEYNSYSGITEIKDTFKTVSIEAKGKAEVSFGPEIAIGLKYLTDIIKLELNAQAGVKLTAEASACADDLTNSLPSKHTCVLCISGGLKWFAEVHVEASYKITKKLSGKIFDLQLYGIEVPIKLPGSHNGEFYFSIIPGPDSVFAKKGNAEPENILGGGSCPNTAYRTALNAQNAQEEELSGISVRVVKNNGKVNTSRNTPGVLYLHDGIYTASATINGTQVSKTVIVKGNPQNVTLSPTSGNKQLTGKVVEASDPSVAISGATVKVSADDLVIATATTESNGSFAVSLPEGTYLVEITKSGHIPFSIYQVVDHDQQTTQMETIELIPGGGMGGFKGVITDATDDMPISGVSLELRAGWNNDSHGEVIEFLSTNSRGEFRYNTSVLPFSDRLLGREILLGLECGNYTLTARKNGYIGTSFNIVVLPGATDMHPDQSATMSPSLVEGGTWRIVLTWGENPRDLDSHVAGKLSDGGSFHVYFGDKSQYDSGVEVCNLDHDDVTSYGPETITLNPTTGDPYYYYIHRYAGSGTIASSGAQIKVYHGDAIVRTFNVPTGLGDGDYWNVFAIVDGVMVIENTMTHSPDLEYAGEIGFSAMEASIAASGYKK